jgi:transposase-like protein
VRVAVGRDRFGGREAGPEGRVRAVGVRQVERDSGRRPGATCEELAELKRLKRENAELRRADDILRAAAHVLGAELDCQSTR